MNKFLEILLLYSILSAFMFADKNEIISLNSEWEKTECLPTYNGWSSDKCFVQEIGITPFDNVKTCWIKKDTCFISFTKQYEFPSFIAFMIFMISFRISQLCD